jgi:hypothetical protein
MGLAAKRFARAEARWRRVRVRMLGQTEGAEGRVAKEVGERAKEANLYLG